MSSPDWELPDVELPFTVASLDATPSGDALAQDAGFLIYPQAGTDEQPLFVSSEEVRFAAKELASAMINLVPVIGQTKAFIEGAIGKDLISGRNLAWWERGLNLVAIIPHAHGAKGIAHALGEIGHITHKVNTVVHAKHGAEVWHGPLKTGTERTNN
jgi:hypothetical protein